MTVKHDLYGDGIGFVECVEHMGSDLTVVNSARVSFGKHKHVLEKDDEKLIEYLIRHRHTSTLEHNLITFRFKVPLFIRSQHHRHRTWSYNEISRRYTNFNLEFYEPKEFRQQSKSNRQASTDCLFNPHLGSVLGLASEVVQEHHEASLYLYEKLLEAGVCREQARGVLPQNLYTEYYGTANLNNILKFVNLRMHEGAQWEIQQVAKGVLDIAESVFPVAVKAYRKIQNEKSL